MTTYKLKRGYTKDIKRIQNEIEKCFELKTEINNNKINFQYKFLKDICISFINNELQITTTKYNNYNINDDEILIVNSKLRNFLYLATGYNTKERIKKNKI